MRGKLVDMSITGYARGLIPAHAGKTLTGRLRFPGGRAHPRACGENTLIMRVKSPIKGSSPRMRGKRLEDVIQLLHVRLIPAHAGKTDQQSGRRLVSRAHPRACGENTSRPFLPLWLTGSSPRMRGKRSRRSARACARRLIPAHAGKTLIKDCSSPL